MDMPTKETLESLYISERKSPEQIGGIYGRSGRTVRNWMKSYGIDRQGPTHLRTGKSAFWNRGIPKPSHVIEAARAANTGKIPHNKGKGNITFRCEACGNTVSDKVYRRKRTCSSKCRNAMMAALPLAIQKKIFRT